MEARVKAISKRFSGSVSSSVRSNSKLRIDVVLGAEALTSYIGSVDIIRLEGIQIEASIGVYDREHGILQPLIIDIAVHTDFSEAASRDHIGETVDYDHLADLCTKVLGQEHHKLIETVAVKLASAVLERFSVVETTIRVSKPRAGEPLASVEVTRRRVSSASQS